MDWESSPKKLSLDAATKFTANIDDPTDTPQSAFSWLDLTQFQNEDDIKALAQKMEKESAASDTSGWEASPKTVSHKEDTKGWETAPKEVHEKHVPDSLMPSINPLHNAAMGVGVLENAANLATGLGGMIAGGLGGLATMNGDNVHKIQEAMTYQPRTDAGKELNKNIGKAFEKVTDEARKTARENLWAIPGNPFNIGEKGEDKDFTEMLANIVGDLGANFLPLDVLHGTAGKGAKAVPNDLPNMWKFEPEVPPTPAPAPEAAPIIPEHTAAHVDDFATINPYNVAGHVTELEQGRPLRLDDPQMDMFGRGAEGVIPPKVEDVNPNSLLNDRFKGNTVDYGLSLAESPKGDGGVRHIDPDTGKVVQGMDKSVPTVDFPLKTEVLDQDHRITQMREMIAQQEAFNEQARAKGAPEPQMEALKQSLDHLKALFGEYLDKNYGIKSAADAFPKLIETGVETKLPIKKTMDARKGNGMGRFKKQGGAINPDLLTFGVSKLIDQFRKSGSRTAEKDVLNKFKGTFHEDALNLAMKEHNDPKSYSSLYWMDPRDFLKVALDRDIGHPVDLSNDKRSSIRKGLSSEAGLRDIPFLKIAQENGEARVHAHEGRHRADIMIERGIDKMPVRMIDFWHRNEDGPLPYNILKGEKRESAVKMPQRINLTEESPTAVTASLLERIKAQNQISHDLNSVNKFNKQGGGINTKAIGEGVQALKERFKRTGVPNALAEMFSKEAKAPAAPDHVLDPALVALKNTAGGKGISDFSPLNKTPEQVVDMLKNAPDMDKAPIQGNVENGGIFRAVASKNPLVKYTYERFEKARIATDQVVKKYLTNPKDGLVAKLRTLSDNEKASLWNLEIMNEGHHEFTDAELAARGFNEKQIDAYRTRSSINDMIYDRINTVRAQIGMKPMDRRVGHLVGAFTGDFRILAKQAVLDEHGNPKLDVNGNIMREPVGFIGASTRMQAKYIAKEMAKLHPDWDLGEIEYRKLAQGASAQDRYAGMMELVNEVIKDDPKMTELLNTYSKIMRRDAETFLNMHQTAKGKKATAGGLEGSEGNKAWLNSIENAKEGMTAQLKYFENAFKWEETQKAILDVRKITDDPSVATSQPNAIKWSESYRDHIIGRNGGTLGQALNTVLNEVGGITGLGHSNITHFTTNVKHWTLTKFMGFGNIPFTLTQLIQPLQTVPPMATLLKSRGIEYSATSAALNAMKSSTKLAFDWGERGNGARFDQFEKAMYDFADKNETFDVKMLDHTRDISAGKWAQRFDKVANANIEVAEAATRGYAYSFFSHALKDTGMPLEEVFGTAHTLTQTVMGDYTKGGRPMVFDKGGFLGDIASTLTRYSANQISQMLMYGREAKQGIKKGNPEAVAPLGTFMATQFAMAGIKGVIAYEVADKMYRMWTQYVTQEPDSLTDMIARSKLPQVLTHGVFAAAGVDMTSHLSGPGLMPASPTDVLVPFGSGVTQMAESAYQAVRHPNAWNTKRAALAIAPNSIHGFLENQLFTDKDGMYLNPNSGEGAVKRDDTQQRLRNFGFTTMKEANERNQVWEFNQRNSAQSEVQKKILKDAYTDVLSESMTPEKIREYNNRFLKAGSGTFVNQLIADMVHQKLTAKQQAILRQSLNNYASAENLKELTNPAYNK